MRIPRPRFAIYGAALLFFMTFTSGRASASTSTAPPVTSTTATSDPAGTVHGPDSGVIQEPDGAAAEHVITGAEIQSRLDQKVHSEESDRQAIRDLLARPEVRRIAGSAGLSLERADAAVATLSGPELTRLATQAREADSAIVGGRGTVTMTWTTVILIVVALVVLLAVL